MVSFRVYLEGVDGNWFQQGSFRVSKKPISTKYEIADATGTVETLEGPMAYDSGHYIITGSKGEQYPITPEKFKTLYDDQGEGTAIPKKIIKVAKLADHDGILKTPWGNLEYKKGQHYIVRHGPNDYGPVENSIFEKTYQRE